MSRYTRIFSALIASLSCLGAAYSSIAYSSQPTTFLGPTARLGYTSPLTDNTAFSLLGEAGLKNFRVGGTVGWRIDPNSRIKFSGEYLWQKITYAFNTGHSDQWVQQGALGAGYQYNFSDVRFKPAIDLDAYLAQARSKPLSNVSGTYVNSAGILIPFTEIRRIAGSHARGISPGVSVAPWWGSRIGIALDYDQIRYDTQNIPDVTASGLGGTINISQAITDDVSLAASGSDRKIFNNYEGSLAWSNLRFYGRWTLGVFGDYTKGKKTLPNTYNVGLSVDYFVEKPVAAPMNLKGEANLKGEIPAVAPADDFLAWTANPAVYMPQVLAITDPKTSACPAGAAPVLITPILDMTSSEIGTDIPLAPNFSGADLTFSLVSVTPALEDSDTVTVTPSGLLSFDVSMQYTVTIQAANSCGSVQTSFIVGESIGLKR